MFHDILMYVLSVVVLIVLELQNILSILVDWDWSGFLKLCNEVYQNVTRHQLLELYRDMELFY